MQADPKLCIARQMYRKAKDVMNNRSAKLDTHFSLFHRAFLFIKLPSPTHALFYTILYSLLSYVKIP
jgi:hypothetical protein